MRGVPSPTTPPASASSAAVASGPRRPAGAGRVLIGVTAVFGLAVAAVLVAGQWVQPREEPWRSKALSTAKQRLQTEPTNESLKREIRDLDLELRRRYFHGLERSRSGTWLLVGAGVALVLLARELNRRPHSAPQTAPGTLVNREDVARLARRTVLVTAVVGAVGFTGLGLMTHSRLPDFVRDTAGAAEAKATGSTTNRGSLVATVPTGPAPEVWARNWPRFRGPEGSGVTARTNLPLTWAVDSGEGVVWKAAIGLPGYNSPVVWEDRVFLTGGDKQARRVYCFDAASGALRWERAVTPTNTPPATSDVPDQSGAAASTVATDGQRVFAIFANGELGALDFEGRLVWSKRLDFSRNGYGHASSLVVWRDRLLVQADQGQPEDGKSTLTAYDAATGNVAWTARRPVGGSWATPVVVDVAGSSLVLTAGDPWLMAHDAATGAERWRAKVLGGELAPSPVCGGGFVVGISPGKALVAVKLEGSGDVTASQVAWKIDQEVPDVPSPVIVGDRLITANTEGHLISRDLASGRKLGELKFELEFQASPLLAGNRLYLFAQPGDVVVVDAGGELKELARFKMDDEIYASPAVAGDRLFVRTKKTLFCLGGAAGPTKVADAR